MNGFIKKLLGIDKLESRINELENKGNQVHKTTSSVTKVQPTENAYMSGFNIGNVILDVIQSEADFDKGVFKFSLQPTLVEAILVEFEFPTSGKESFLKDEENGSIVDLNNAEMNRGAFVELIRSGIQEALKSAFSEDNLRKYLDQVDATVTEKLDEIQ